MSQVESEKLRHALAQRDDLKYRLDEGLKRERQAHQVGEGGGSKQGEGRQLACL
jgi:hypothetical protein